MTLKSFLCKKKLNVMKNYYFIFIALLAFLQSCKEPNVTPENNLLDPLNIKLNSTEKGIEVSWNGGNVRDFQSYIITRSLGSQDFNSQIKTWSIEDPSNTQLLDDNLPLAKTIYYSVKIITATRTITSKKVAINRSDVVAFDVSHLSSGVMGVNAKNKCIYGYNSVGTLSRLNFTNGSAKVFPENSVGNYLYNESNPDYLYQPNSGMVKVINADDGSEVVRLDVTSINQWESPASICNLGNFFYVLWNDFSGTIGIFRNDGTFIKKITLTTYNISYPGLIVGLNDKNQLLVFTSNSSTSFLVADIDKNTGLITDARGSRTSASLYASQVRVSKNGQILSQGQMIYNIDGSIAFLQSDLIFKRFSEDGKYALAASSSSSNMLVFDLETNGLINSFSLPISNPNQNSFFISDGYVYNYGFDFNSSVTNFIVVKSKI